MGKGKKYRVHVPEGTHLDHSRETPGARRGTLRDDKTNQLVGHAELVEVEDDDESFLPAIAGLALIGLTAKAIGVLGSAASHRADEREADAEERQAEREERAARRAERAAERDERAAQRADEASQRWERRRNVEWQRAEARRTAALERATQAQVAPAGWYDEGGGRLRWWDGHQWTQDYRDPAPKTWAAGWYDDGSGTLRWWDGHQWTQFLHAPAPRGGTEWAPPSPEDVIEPSSANTVAVAGPHRGVHMDAAEWRERMRLMLVASAIAEEQWELLSSAVIVDGDAALLGWQNELKRLTAGEFSQLVYRQVETRAVIHREAVAIEATREPAPAGWFDDGTGTSRWWDGRRWSDHVR